MAPTKKFEIPKKIVWEAFERSKNSIVVGVDGQTIRDFTFNRTKRLHELWEQLSTGKYVPSPVRRAYKRKPDGQLRPIGKPTVKDQIVQRILRNQMSSKINVLFHPNSFFHNKSSKAGRGAIEAAQNRCLRYNWALILDVKKYGENIDHEILMNMLRKHIKNPWVLLYTHRILKAPIQVKNGTLVHSKKGLPQDAILSFFLNDFYLHDIFDEWMKKNHPDIPFERWIDDIIIHCKSEALAKKLLSEVEQRFRLFKLEKNNHKTKIVYCKDSNRPGTYKNVSFQFLEKNFRSRTQKLKSGKHMDVFGPG